MFNSIIGFSLVLPQIIFGICFVTFMMGSIYGIWYYILKQSDRIILKITKHFDVDSPAWNSSIITNTLYFMMIILEQLGFVSNSNVSMTAGMASICCLWYIVYKIDVLYNMYRGMVLNRDMQRKK